MKISITRVDVWPSSELLLGERLLDEWVGVDDHAWGGANVHGEDVAIPSVKRKFIINL